MSLSHDLPRLDSPELPTATRVVRFLQSQQTQHFTDYSAPQIAPGQYPRASRVVRMSRSIGGPTYAGILFAMLASQWMHGPYITTAQLAELVGCSKSTAAKYLTALCDMQLVERAREGVKVWYRIASENLTPHTPDAS